MPDVMMPESPFGQRLDFLKNENREAWFVANGSIPLFMIKRDGIISSTNNTPAGGQGRLDGEMRREKRWDRSGYAAYVCMGDLSANGLVDGEVLEYTLLTPKDDLFPSFFGSDPMTKPVGLFALNYIALVLFELGLFFDIPVFLQQLQRQSRREIRKPVEYVVMSIALCFSEMVAFMMRAKVVITLKP